MATSGRIDLTITGLYSISGWISWEESDINESANTSKVTAKLHYKNPSSSSTYSSVANPPFTLTINGNSKTTSTGATLPAYSNDTVVLTHSVTVTHNTDGSKSITISGGGGLSGTGGLQDSTGSGTAVLTSIPRGKPTASLALTTSTSNPTISGWNVLVKGFTTVSYTLTGTPYSGSGASITAYEFNGNGETKTTSTGTTNVLASSGTLFFMGKVMDSRNIWSETDIKTISNVYNYNPPRITAFTAFRSTSGGTESATGTYITMSCSASIGDNADIGNRNSIASIAYVITDNDSGTTVKTGTLTNGTSSTVSSFSDDHSYLVTVTATDTVGSAVTRSIVVPMSVTTFHMKENGLAVAVGTNALYDRTFTIKDDWNVYMYGALIDPVIQQGLETTTGSQTCDWYYQKYQSGQFYAHMSGTLSSSTSSSTKSATFALPWTLPNTVYQVQLTGTSNSHLLVNMGVRNSAGTGSGKSTTQFTVYATLSSATADSIGVDISLHGYWK